MFEFIFDPLHDMNAIGDMHGLRFSNFQMLLNTIFYILPLAIIIVLEIKAVDFSQVSQTLCNIFATHYGDVRA